MVGLDALFVNRNRYFFIHQAVLALIVGRRGLAPVARLVKYRSLWRFLVITRPELLLNQVEFCFVGVRCWTWTYALPGHGFVHNRPALLLFHIALAFLLKYVSADIVVFVRHVSLAINSVVNIGALLRCEDLPKEQARVHRRLGRDVIAFDA